VVSAQVAGNIDIEWISAQVHGHIIFDGTRHAPYSDVLRSHRPQQQWHERQLELQKDIPNKGNHPNFKSYGGHNSVCILASDPCTLTSNARISNSRLHIYQVQALLPQTLPPSYRCYILNCDISFRPAFYSCTVGGDVLLLVAIATTAVVDSVYCNDFDQG
jgi:hypothetical protein